MAEHKTHKSDTKAAQKQFKRPVNPRLLKYMRIHSVANRFQLRVIRCVPTHQDVDRRTQTAVRARGLLAIAVLRGCGGPGDGAAARETCWLAKANAAKTRTAQIE